MAIKAINTQGGDNTTPQAGYLNEIQSSSVATTTRSTNGTDVLATLPITKGRWLLAYSLSYKLNPGSAGADWVAASVDFRRDGTSIIGTQSESATDELAASLVIGVRGAYSMLYIHEESAASASITAVFAVTVNGTATAQVNPNGSTNGRVYAIRIG
jgi:hypothetical protein